jgi:uncharacterized protein (UPF0264 family)
MQLLVSVADADEAGAALAGGADVIDAKDPTAGALGAVSLATLRQIRAAVGGARPVTAALGDAADEPTVEAAARAFAAAGAAFVKVGFAGVTDPARAASLGAAAARGAAAGGGAAVLVAYADAARVRSLPADALPGVAAAAGARGVLLDTADKRGPGLLGWYGVDALAAWVRDAHAAGLFAALAGRLSADDVAAVRAVGADIAGVRGAACDGGRTGRVAAGRVRALRAHLADAARRDSPTVVAAVER